MKIGDQVTVYPSKIADEAKLGWTLSAYDHAPLMCEVVAYYGGDHYLVTLKKEYTFHLKSTDVALVRRSYLYTALGYLTFCIPSAILARVVRKTFKRKGTFLEKHLMSYYYKLESFLLGNK